jgi:hypothetical protein
MDCFEFSSNSSGVFCCDSGTCGDAVQAGASVLGGKQCMLRRYGRKER